MHHLIEFTTGTPLRFHTKIGEPTDVIEFKDKPEAKQYAEAMGYEMIIEDRFLLKTRRREKYEPIYIKIVEVKCGA